MKKQITYSILFVIVSLIGYMIYSTVSKVKTKKVVEEKLSTLQDLPLLNIDGLTFRKGNLKANTATIILYFNSECKHCQYEAESISQNAAKFEHANLLWVSYETIPSISQFAKSYNLLNYPNIYFTKIDHEDVYQTFGSVTIPHIFIYDKNSILVKEYKGETKMEALLKYL